jgi:hypothetical protein
MKTYQFTAFRDERFAANGEIQADSPEEAKAKILERYHDEGLIFREYVDGEEPDHFTLIDEAGEEHDLWEEMPPSAERRLLQEILERLSSRPMQDDELSERIRSLGMKPKWQVDAEKAMRAAGGAA